MARGTAVAIENNFVNGLVTEATGLNFPEAAVTETFNCVFDQNGTVARRLGIDLETDFQTKIINKTGKVITTFTWRAAAGRGDNSFVVMQVGHILYFYQVDRNGALSSNPLTAEVDISTFALAGAPAIAEQECQFASGKGYLFVAHPYLDPMYIEYVPSTNNFILRQIIVQIRDFKGLADVYGDTSRPATTTGEHLYNVQNQGWIPARQYTFAAEVGVHPSNSDIWYLFKNADDTFAPGTTAANVERGSSLAPKGSIILNAFYQDRAAAVGYGGFPVVSSSYYRPTTIEFFAGRVWYSGVNYQGFSQDIYFTQIIERDNQFGRCFQTNDPTSESNSELLPTDGGVINIPEIETIIRLKSIEGYLIVFATNGIWAIGGSTGVGFAANDYTVRKISTVAAVSNSSFTDVLGYPSWWNDEGIYVISVDGQAGNIQAQPLVENKLNEFYDAIPQTSKRYSRGFYNPLTKVIQWLYRTTPPETVQERYEYDAILNFNTLKASFYPWTIPTETVKLNSIVAIEGQGSTFDIENVTNSLGENVVTDLGTEVTVDVLVQSQLSSTFKYLVSYTLDGANVFSFAEERDLNHVDWASVVTDGEDYESYFITGYKLRGQGMTKFQTKYIILYTRNTSPSTFLFQTIWDYATDSLTGRWSTKQRVSHAPLSYKYASRKLLLRGSGRALQFKVTSVPGEPFDLIGWTTWEGINQTP